MSLFIVCFDLKNAESGEYEIWENAFDELYKYNCKKIERTTWLLYTDGRALDVYKAVLEYVKSVMVARAAKNFLELDEDLCEMIDDYTNMEINELEACWRIERNELEKIEKNVDKYLEDVKIFIGEITKSEDNVAGCLSKNDWLSQPVSPAFDRYFKRKNGKCKIRLI